MIRTKWVQHLSHVRYLSTNKSFRISTSLYLHAAKRYKYILSFHARRVISNSCMMVTSWIWSFGVTPVNVRVPCYVYSFSGRATARVIIWANMLDYSSSDWPPTCRWNAKLKFLQTKSKCSAAPDGIVVLIAVLSTWHPMRFPHTYQICGIFHFHLSMYMSDGVSANTNLSRLAGPVLSFCSPIHPASLLYLSI